MHYTYSNTSVIRGNEGILKKNYLRQSYSQLKLKFAKKVLHVTRHFLFFWKGATNLINTVWGKLRVILVVYICLMNDN